MHNQTMKKDRVETIDNSHHHIYHGHRAESFYITENGPELDEIRARQRTFDGAAYRTAMGNLSYAIVILKLFDVRFYRIGILYTVLSIILFILAYFRSQRAKHDFADIHRPIPSAAIIAAIPQGAGEQQQSSKKIVVGRAFKTAGWSVITVSAVVFAVEVVLFVLILDV